MGGTLALGGDDPFTAAKTLNHLKPTALYMAPIQLKALLDALPRDFAPLPGLGLTVSGAHTPRAVRDEARMRLASTLTVIYGTTEAGAIAYRSDYEATDDADAGWISSWVELEIVNETHQPVAPGTLGRIRVRGADVIDHYIDDEEANKKFFRDGWFYPGDVGSLTPEGRLRVEGRTDEMMNFGGASFMPHVIEGAVMACAGVADAAAFAMPDKNGFDAPWIAVVRQADLKEQDVAKALMLPGLPPAHVVWIDQIPRTANGKVHRDRLQAAARTLKSN
jgi:acyl-CoA synthetase (AMP-forming)/AMP-acid ligase II